MRRRIVALAIGFSLFATAGYAQSSGILTGIVSTYERASHDWIRAFRRHQQESLRGPRGAGVGSDSGGGTSSLHWGLGRSREALGRAVAEDHLYRPVLGFYQLVYSLDPEDHLELRPSRGLDLGYGGLQPSLVLDRGVFLCTLLLYSIGRLGTLNSLAAIPASILVYLSALGLLVCFALISARLVEALVKSYLVVAGAIWFLGFAPFRLTAPLAETTW